MTKATGRTLEQLDNMRKEGKALTGMQRKVLKKQGAAMGSTAKSFESPAALLIRQWQQRSFLPVIKLLLPGGAVKKVLEDAIRTVFPAATALEILARLPITAAQLCQFYAADDCQNWLKQFANISKDSSQEDCYAACSRCQNFESGAVDQCSEILWTCLQAMPAPDNGHLNRLSITGIVLGCVALLSILTVWKCWSNLKKRVDPLLGDEAKRQRHNETGVHDPRYMELN